MSMEVGQLHLALTADLTKYDASMRLAKERAEALDKQFAGAQWAGQRLASIGNALTLGVTMPLTIAAGAATKLAMESIETENLFKVSMANMADQAEAFAKSMSASLGTNRFDVEKSIGTLNVMFKSMGLNTQQAYDMATALTKLGYDMGSFYNISNSDAFVKLRAGIVGETEPLKQIGILVDEATVKTAAYQHGIAAQGSELTQQQKVLARYAAIMDQTSLAQGDLARTIDSPTNRLRTMTERFKEAGAVLGQSFTPLVTSGATALANAATWLTNLDPLARGLVITLGALVAAIGPLLSITGNLITNGPALLGFFAKVSGAIAGMTATVAPWVWGLLAAGAAIAGIIALVKGANEAQAEADKRVATLTDRYRQIKKAMDDANTPLAEKVRLADEEKTITDELSDLLPENVGYRDAEGKLITLTLPQLEAYIKLKDEEAAATKRAAEEKRKDSEEYNRNMLARLEARKQALLAGRLTGTLIDEFGRKVEGASTTEIDAELARVNQQIERTKSILGDLSAAVAGTGPAAPRTNTNPPPTGGGGGGGTKTALDFAKEKVANLGLAMELLQEETTNAIRSQGLAEDSTRALQMQAEALTKQIDMQRKVVDAAAEVVERLAKAQGKTAAETMQARIELEKQRGALLDLEAEEKRIADEKLAKEVADAEAMAPGYNKIMAGLKEYLGGEAGYSEYEKLYGITTGLDGEALRSAAEQNVWDTWIKNGMKFVNGLPALAKGGTATKGGAVIVGDGGKPEIVNLPTGATVTPLDQAGATVYVGAGAVVIEARTLKEFTDAAEFFSRLPQAIRRQGG